jgi:hypothetical protein
MATSLFDPDVLTVFGDAKSSSGGTGAPFPSSAPPVAAPFPSPIDWRNLG